jgi:hypothetical protein
MFGALADDIYGPAGHRGVMGQRYN